VRQWLASIDDQALRELDVQLLVDLLRIEDDPIRWSALAAVVATEVERSVLAGELESAERLASAILIEQHTGRRGLLVSAAAGVADKLSSGPLLRHLITQLRSADDPGVAAATRLCHALGAGAVRPLAEALAVEENSKVIRALREILLEFGAVGRSSVEQLKNSTNPAVRRTAIDLLRVFGGDEALPELESMLGDGDQQVQRDAVRAIVQIGSEAAYAVLQHALGGVSRDAIVQQLISLRDDKAIPLLCHVLSTTSPGGPMTAAHLHIIEALGALKAHPQSTEVLRTVLYRGTWWAPSRTARLREAAAMALQRIGSPETTAILEEAVNTGGRSVRRIARAAATSAVRRERRSA
jgi:HEAT repeat protein